MLKEKMHFGNWWLYAILLVFVAFFTVAFILQIALNQPIADNQLSNELIIGFCIFFYFIWAFMAYTRLKIKVNEEGLAYQFIPWHKTPILLGWEKIASCKIRKYSAYGEFGNYGTRIKDDTLAMVASGTVGIELSLSNGAKIIFSTKKPKQFNELINHYLSEKSENKK